MENTIVGLKELRGNINTYVSKVKKGDSFIVVRKSKPLFKIVSLEFDELVMTENLRKGKKTEWQRFT